MTMPERMTRKTYQNPTTKITSTKNQGKKIIELYLKNRNENEKVTSKNQYLP